MKLYSDYKSVISIAHNPVHHWQNQTCGNRSSLHKEDRRMIIGLSHVSTKFQEADILTKVMGIRDSNSLYASWEW